VTVTMRVHPLGGMQLAVVSFKRDHQSGRRFVVVEHPRGGQLVLPLDWTDRGPLQQVPTVDGREVVADVAALLRLAQAVSICRKVDVDRPAPVAGAHRSAHASSADTGSTAVGGVAGGDAARRALRVGDVGAQDTTAKRGTQ
jgi:hypothetical protein